MIVDLTFQTREANTKHEEAIDLARSILRTAQTVLVETMLKAYPVGARVRLQVGPRKWAYSTVHSHTLHPSKWVTITNDKTGSKRTIDITTASVELVCYAYEVRDIRSARETGKDFIIGMPDDYHFTSGDPDPLKNMDPERRYSVVPK